MTGSSVRRAHPEEIDPKFVKAVSTVVRIVLLEQERERADRSTAPATHATRPTRPDLRRLYDVPSAASQLSISPAKAWELIKDGRLRVVKVDGRTLVRASELDRFVLEEVRPA